MPPKRSCDTPRISGILKLHQRGPVTLIVSLDEQRLYVYRNGVTVGSISIRASFIPCRYLRHPYRS